MSVCLRSAGTLEGCSTGLDQQSQNIGVSCLWRVFACPRMSFCPLLFCYELPFHSRPIYTVICMRLRYCPMPIRLWSELTHSLVRPTAISFASVYGIFYTCSERKVCCLLEAEPAIQRLTFTINQQSEQICVLQLAQSVGRHTLERGHPPHHRLT